MAIGLLGYAGCNHPQDYENHDIGCSPDMGFDCSGFVKYVLELSQASVPETIRHVSEFFDGFGIFVHRFRPGDLIFFSKNGRAPRHMGIVVNNEEYIHSPGKNGSKVSVAAIKKEPIVLRHDDQIYIENPIGFKSPSIQKGRWQEII